MCFRSLFTRWQAGGGSGRGQPLPASPCPGWACDRAELRSPRPQHGSGTADPHRGPTRRRGERSAPWGSGGGPAVGLCDWSRVGLSTALPAAGTERPSGKRPVASPSPGSESPASTQTRTPGAGDAGSLSPCPGLGCVSVTQDDDRPWRASWRATLQQVPEPRRPSETLRLLPPRTPSALCTGASGSGPGRPVFLRGGEGLSTQVTSLGKRRERPEDEAWTVHPQATSPARELCPGGRGQGVLTAVTGEDARPPFLHTAKHAADSQKNVQGAGLA